jgi:hypothetical protein
VQPVRAIRFFLPLIASLAMIGGCQRTSTVYTASPEIVAVFAGQARGADFSLARACGAEGQAVVTRVAQEQAPASLSSGAATLYRAALNARAAETMERPDPDLCAALRGRQDFSALFQQALSSSARPSAAPERRARTAAYCADGSEAVRRDPTMTAGLRAIRASCKPGDTVALPVEAVGIIASACDLSKPAPVAGPSVFCTLSTVREIRTVASERSSSTDSSHERSHNPSRSSRP